MVLLWRNYQRELGTAAAVTKTQIHKLWRYFFFGNTNKGVTVAVEKVLSIAGHVQNYSGGWDGDSEAGRVAVHYSYPSLNLVSFVQFQEKANNHVPANWFVTHRTFNVPPSEISIWLSRLIFVYYRIPSSRNEIKDKRALALSRASLLNRLLTMCSESKELFQGRETQKLCKTCTTLLDSTSKVIFHQPWF